MKFYDVTDLLYLETDASGIGFGASLLHTGSGTSCPRDKERKQHTQTHCVCKQEFVKCRKKIMQY